MKNSIVSTDMSSSPQPNSLAFVIVLPKTDRQWAKARVGALPIPLRIILAAQKLGPAQIVVIGDPATKRNTRWELMRTHRVPESVQWLEARGDGSLQEQLRVIAKAVTSQRVKRVNGPTSKPYCPSRMPMRRSESLQWPLICFAKSSHKE